MRVKGKLRFASSRPLDKSSRLCPIDRSTRRLPLASPGAAPWVAVLVETSPGSRGSRRWPVLGDVPLQDLMCSGEVVKADLHVREKARGPLVVRVAREEVSSGREDLREELVLARYHHVGSQILWVGPMEIVGQDLGPPLVTSDVLGGLLTQPWVTKPRTQPWWRGPGFSVCVGNEKAVGEQKEG